MRRGTWTGCRDRHGRRVRVGDVVRYELSGSHTKREHWNPEYGHLVLVRCGCPRWPLVLRDRLFALVGFPQ